jgi:hypothetical protein
MAVVICPNCKSPNPGSNRFCQRCFRSLAGVTVEAPVAGEEPAGPPSAGSISSPAIPLPALGKFQISVYTDTFKVVGSLETPHRRLTDALILDERDFLSLSDCLLTALVEGYAEDRLLPRVQIRLTDVLFAVPHSESPPRAGSSQPVRVSKRTHPVGLLVPGWSVEGNLHLLPGALPRRILMSMGIRTDSFLPLTNAFADCLSNSRCRIGPETIIVQRARINVFWSHDAE